MSRMSAIRDAIKGASPMLKTGAIGSIAAGAVATGLGMNSGKDLNTSLGIGGSAALGASAGMMAGSAAGLSAALPRAAKAGLSGNMGRFFSRSSSLLKPSMTKMLAGGLIGAFAGGGYAVLKSNKAPSMSYGDRLSFETKRKQMTVDENLRQMKALREIMNETRMR